MMHITCFSEYTLPRQGSTSRAQRKTVAFNQTQSQDRNYLQDQQQTVYEELVASPGPVPESEPPARCPNWSLLSAAESTRDLAGWTIPQRSVLREKTTEVAPKHGKNTVAKIHHN